MIELAEVQSWVETYATNDDGFLNAIISKEIGTKDNPKTSIKAYATTGWCVDFTVNLVDDYIGGTLHYEKGKSRDLEEGTIREGMIEVIIEEAFSLVAESK